MAEVYLKKLVPIMLCCTAFAFFTAAEATNYKADLYSGERNRVVVLSSAGYIMPKPSAGEINIGLVPEVSKAAEMDENINEEGGQYILLKVMFVILLIPYIAAILIAAWLYLEKKSKKNEGNNARHRNFKQKKPFNKNHGKIKNDVLPVYSEDFGNSAKVSETEQKILKEQYAILNVEYYRIKKEKKEWKRQEKDLLHTNRELVIEAQKDKDRIADLEKTIDELRIALQRKTDADVPKRDVKTIDIYNANINSGGRINLEKAALTVKAGRVAVEKGGYVYIEPSENGLLLYPTSWITDSTIREALSMYFNIEITGTNRILLKKPCVLSKDMYGYIVVEKGLVVIY